MSGILYSILLQTAYISNENHVKKAQTAAEGAKAHAQKANADLYKLNSGFKKVSDSLTNKESNIGDAKEAFKCYVIQKKTILISFKQVLKLEGISSSQSLGHSLTE